MEREKAWWLGLAVCLLLSLVCLFSLALDVAFSLTGKLTLTKALETGVIVCVANLLCAVESIVLTKRK